MFESRYPETDEITGDWEQQERRGKMHGIRLLRKYNVHLCEYRSAREKRGEARKLLG